VKRIIVGSDQVAVSLKEAVLQHLRGRRLEAIDAGTQSPDVVVDYPDYAQRVAQAVSRGDADGGIVMCGTGLGVSIAANKVAGARAALCHDVFTAHQARAHNDANILAMGAYIVSPQRMLGIVDEWLDTPFEGGRHTARVKSLDRFLPALQTAGPAFDPSQFRYAMALSQRRSVFGPLIFAGRLEEGFAVLAKAGFHCVELSIRNANDMPLEELRGLLDRYGLQVTALATGQGCLHDGLCLSSADPDVHAAAVKRIEEIIAYAEPLHADVILGGVRGKCSGTPDEQARQREQAVKAYQDCDRCAQQRGVRLLLEPINRYETNLVNTAAEALAFLDAAGTRVTKLLLDTFHMNIEEVHIPTTLRMAGERLGYVHIVDSNRQAPGQGHIPFQEIFETLGRMGYRGTISAEVLPLPDDDSAVLRTANFLASLGVPMGTTFSNETTRIS
jgi:5-keto-L-gluconate epimerase